MTNERLDRRLDRLGWLELIGIGLGLGTLLGLAFSQLVLSAANGDVSTPAALVVGVVVGLIAGAVTVLLVARDWHKHGGRQLQRLGRRTWSTGHLPDDLPTRYAVLRDLERRQQKLDRAWIPGWVLAVVWTVIAAGSLTVNPDPWKALIWIGLWAVMLTSAIFDLIDRRRRPRLQHLITELRHHPVPAGSAALPASRS